jgi:hypothetical protein
VQHLHQPLHMKTSIILTYIILITSIIMMSIHMIYIHVLFFPHIYDAFCPWLCLTMLALDEVIKHETTANQVFSYNFTICI